MTSEKSVLEYLQVPWRNHETLPMLKKVCSTKDGLHKVSKRTNHKILQELKKTQKQLEQEIKQMECQLLHVTDYINGYTDKIQVPEYPLIKTSEMNINHAVNTSMDIKSHDKTSDKTNPLLHHVSPMSQEMIIASVENDLTSETPCTTRGLWNYIQAYAYFDPITMHQVDKSLQFTDIPGMTIASDFNDTITCAENLETQAKNAFLRERLLSALVALPDLKDTTTNRVWPSYSSKNDLDTVKKEESSFDTDIENLFHQIDLLEISNGQLSHAIANPQDDELSQELRLLETQERFYALQNNTRKQLLRQKLFQDERFSTEMHDGALKKKQSIDYIEKKYLKMWRKRKTIVHKKKLQEQKRKRQKAELQEMDINDKKDHKV